MGLRPFQISYSPGPATEIHSGKGAVTNGRAKSSIRPSSNSRSNVHQKLGHRLTLRNSLRHFAHPFPNFTGVGEKCEIWSRFFDPVAFYVLWFDTKQHTWWNPKPSLETLIFWQPTFLPNWV